MKKTLIPILLIFLFTVPATHTHAQVLKTKLKVSVRNDLGNSVKGAVVTLYKTQADYENNENAIQTGETDEKGCVLFKELEPVSYFMDARKGDQNNDGRGVQTTKLIAKKKNMVATIIE